MSQTLVLYLAIALMVIGALVALPRGALWRAWTDSNRTNDDRPPQRLRASRAARPAAPASLKRPAATHPPPPPMNAARERPRHAARHS